MSAWSSVSSLCFAFRNTGKVLDADSMSSKIGHHTDVGDIGRVAVVPAQILKSAKAIDKWVEKTEKTDNILGKTVKGVEFATKIVNPLLCGAAAIRVARADDKGAAFTKEGLAMTSMFIGEHYAKKALNSSVLTNFTGSKLINTIADSKLLRDSKMQESFKNLTNSNFIKWVDKISQGKYSGKIGKIIKGVAFVTASVCAYDLGAKAGNYLVDATSTKKPLAKNDNYNLNTSIKSKNINLNDSIIKSSLESSTKMPQPAIRLSQIA